jgi:hypothetical protein
MSSSTRSSLLRQRSFHSLKISEIDSKLAELEESDPAEPDYWGSRAPYPPPPDRSPRWMREHGPELLAYGAERIGGARGRSVVWRIRPADYRRWLDAQRSPAPTESGPVELDVDQLIESAGYRLSRRAG